MVRLDLDENPLFGLQNLPYGVYSADGPRRCATRVGDHVVDLAMTLDDPVFESTSLNDFMAQGPSRWADVRAALQDAVSGELPDDAVRHVHEVELHLPAAIGDYVDCYGNEHHAANLGRLFRPDNPDPLPVNWKHLPVGYHGRAASVVVSGTDIVRPCGQRMPPGADAPVFGPSTRLDIEAELGFLVGTPNPMGERIEVEDAHQHLFGVVIFNDWSARDIQAWEYVPLGPNLGKSFASTVSPWIVTMEALAAARVDTPPQDPAPLPYLAMESPWGLDIDLEVEWNGEVVARPPYRTTYWSPAQMLAHISVNGAPIGVGDLFASGTISGPERDTRGALIELTWGGAEPVSVRGRESTFLEDDDEIVITATAPSADGGRLGFGECRGRILPVVE